MTRIFWSPFCLGDKSLPDSLAVINISNDREIVEKNSSIIRRYFMNKYNLSSREASIVTYLYRSTNPPENMLVTKLIETLTSNQENIEVKDLEAIITGEYFETASEEEMLRYQNMEI